MALFHDAGLCCEYNWPHKNKNKHYKVHFHFVIENEFALRVWLIWNDLHYFTFAVVHIR